MKNKDHFYVSRTGVIFVLTKCGDKWYLAGSPLIKESKMLWPVGIATSFSKIREYIKNSIGLLELR